MKQFNFLSKTKWLLVPFMLITLGVGNAWGVEEYIFEESGGGSVDGWTFTNGTTTNSIDQSSYWLLDAGSTKDYIITSAYDLSAYESATVYATIKSYGSGNTYPPLKIEISYNGGTTWSQSYTTSNVTSSNANYNVTLNSTLTNNIKVRLSNNGNSGRGIRVTNFKLKVTYTPVNHTVNWYVNGSLARTQTALQGATLTEIPTPTSSNCDGKKSFVGWTETSNYASETTAPTDLLTSTTGMMMPNADKNYYAVFANVSGGVVTITPSCTNKTSTGYEETTWSAESTDGDIYTGHIKVYSTNSNPFQVNNNQAPTFYNDDAFSGAITKIKIIKESGNDRSWTPRLSASTKQNSATASNGTNLTAKTVGTNGATWDIAASNDYRYVYLGLAGGATYISSIEITYGGTTNYATTCCTSLGSINGSISLSNEGCTPTQLKATWRTTATAGISSQILHVYNASNNNEVTASKITGISPSTSNQTQTINGLAPCTSYYVIVENVSQGGTYCDGGLITDKKSSSVQTGHYNVSFSGCSNVTNDGEATTCAAADYSVTFAGSSARYALPENVTSVTIGGVAKTQGTHFTWNQGTGVLTIPQANITGNIVIDVDGVDQGACESTPVLGAASLSGTFSLTNVGVTCASITPGDYCDVTEYGFIWYEGTGNKEIGGSGVTKVTNNGAYTSGAFVNTLTKNSFTAETTYTFRAYATNSGGLTGYSAAASFTPYTVSYNKNDESATGTVATVVVNAGGSVTLPNASAFSLDCNDMTKWALNSAEGTQYDPEATYSNINANAVFYAVWNKRTYTVQFAAGSTPANGGAITGSHANATKTCGKDLTLPGVTFYSTGYTQIGWAKSDGGSHSNNLSGKYTSDKEQTFYPEWQINTYNVTKGTATGCSGDDFTVASTATHGSSISVTATADAAHKGAPIVVISPEGNASVSGTTISNITGNITVSVSFDAKEAATVILHDATGAHTQDGPYYEADNYTLPNTAAACTESELYGWYTETYVDQATAPSGAKYIAKNASKALAAGDNHFYAVYATVEDRYTNNYTKITSVNDLTTGDYLIAGISSWCMGNEVSSNSMSESSMSSYLNNGVITNSSNSNIIWTITKNGNNYTLYNAAKEKYLALTTTSPAMQAEPHNFTIALDGTCWVFSSVATEGYVLGYQTYFKSLTAKSSDVLLYKRDKAPQAGAPYTTSPSCTTHDLDVVVTPNGYGTAEAAKTTIVVGRTTTVTATRAIGYEFAYWTIEGEETSMTNTDGEGKSTDNPVTVTMGTEDATITAHFIEKPKYTITLNAGNGIISASGWTAGDVPVWTKTQANGDESITMPTSECNCSGWEFVGWKQGSEVDNASNFTADKNANDAFVPTESLTYYAVYRQSAPDGTTYNKITSGSELTTGDYLFISDGTYTDYAMKNGVTDNRMQEESVDAGGASVTYNYTALVWTIIKFGAQVVIKNGDNYLGIDNDNNICLTTTPHFFTYTYNTTSSRWEFTSATKTNYQLIYNSYFKIGTAQNTAILLYKQGGSKTGNYFTNPSCTSYNVSGAVEPIAGGSVQLTASTAVTGDKVWVYCAPNTGYKFLSWTASEGATLSSSTAALTQVTVGSADVELTANVGVLYNITLANGGTLTNGTIESDLTAACAGETVTLTATPDTHFSWSSWVVTKTGDPNTTVTVTNNQFTMPAYAVTVDAVFAEAPFRTVVFKNSNVKLFDDGDDVEVLDATNKWKQKVYVGETPVWPTALTSSAKIDANSTNFYGWTATPWEGKIASKSTIDAKTGANKVYTVDFTGATVAAGEGEVVYHAVWMKNETEADVIDYSATSSKLSGTNSSTWVSAFDLTGSTGAKYTIYSMGTSGQSYGIKWNANGYLYCKTAPTSGKKLMSVAAEGASQTINIYAKNTAYSASPTGDVINGLAMSGTYNFTSEYQYIAIKGTTGNTTINTLTITYGSFADFITTCHTISGASTSGTAVEYDGDNITIISSHNQAIQGTEITLTVPTATHFTFSSWTVKDESNNDVTVANNKFTMPASDVTVTANWAPKSYSLTVSEPTDGSIAFDGVSAQYTAQDVNYHTAVTLTATPVNDDHYFLGWTISPSIDGVLTTDPELSFSMPGVATSISATFAAVVYPSLSLNEDNLSENSTLSATLTNGGEIVDMSSIKAGTSITVTYTPDGQKELTGWTLTKVGGGDVEYNEDGNTITFYMPDKNLTVTANGEQNYYILNLSAENGSISEVEIGNASQEWANTYRVHEGDAVEVTAIPEDATYKFKEWQKTDIDAENWDEDGAYAYFIVGTSNMTLNAVFEPKSLFDVTLKAMDKTQEVIADKLEGTSVWSLVRYKTAPNLSNYAFQGWCTDIANASTTMITEMTDIALNANITLHAVYQKQACYRKVTSNAGLGNGDYLIVYEGDDKAFNGGLATLDATFNTINVDIRDDYTILADETTDAAKFVITGITGGYSIKSASNKYIGKEANSNGMDTSDDALTNSISINNSQNANIAGSGGRKLSFNTANDQRRFRYMSNSSNIQLYKKEDAGANTATPKDIVADGETLEITSNKVYGDLIIEAGGKVSGSAVLTVNNLLIKTSLGTISGDETNTNGKSGEITNGNKIVANGDVFIEIELTQEDKASTGWYAFSVPFPVDAINGVYYNDTKLTNEVGYAIMSYHGDVRAQGQYAWKKYRGTMQPGTLYIITVGKTYYKTLRFKKVAGADLIASNEIAVKKYPLNGGTTGDNGWNGIGNPNLQVSRYTGSYLIQFLDHQANSFKVRNASAVNLMVGSAFMMQSTATENITITAGNDGSIALAPAREMNAEENTLYEVKLRNNTTNIVEDNLFFMAREDATNSYETGYDLVKLSMGEAKCAQMYVPAYGTKLCAADFPLVNGQAEYPLTITAPAAGSYRIEAAEAYEGATLYLTKDGRAIWNLSMSACEVELTKGTTENYGLLLVRKAPGVATGNLTPTLSQGEGAKILIDEHVYILRGGQMYDLTGKAVK